MLSYSSAYTFPATVNRISSDVVQPRIGNLMTDVASRHRRASPREDRVLAREHFRYDLSSDPDWSSLVARSMSDRLRLGLMRDQWSGKAES